MSEYWQPRRETRTQAIERIKSENGWPDSLARAGSPMLPSTAADIAAWKAKVADRFAPEMTHRAMIERLHIDVGDPDADGDWGDERGTV